MTHAPSDRGTLWSRWSGNAARRPEGEAIVHWSANAPVVRWTWSSLLQEAERLAAFVVEGGIRRGDVCAIIIRHDPLLYPLYLACSRAGAIPAILAYPNSRLHPLKFREGLAGMSTRSGLDWILTERELAPTIRPLVATAGSTIRGVHFPHEWHGGSPAATRGAVHTNRVEGSASVVDPFLLQHSSGTTGLQKPVLLSDAAVQEHVDRYGAAVGLSHTDKIVSWLPLYHDMGLIAAFHLPLALGVPTIQLNPFEWVVVPSILLEAVSAEGGTVSWLPNFAYEMMANRIADDDLNGVDLSSWRLLINCSEPVRHESHEMFIRRFAPLGLRPLALSTCYAMAETTFAVTQTPPGRQPAVMVVDRSELAKGCALPACDGSASRTCVSSGSPISGCEVRVVDEEGQDVVDGIVGEIAVRSVSMFEGYRNYPEKTAEVLRDGWYFTGDYGFRFESEHYVVGRKKDIIIVAGNNIYPEDIEAAISVVEGVIAGRVVAFGEEDPELGTERVSVAAETAVTDPLDRRQLTIAVRKAAMAIDVSVDKVYLVPPRSLIKSSAGKPSRKANKERLLNH